MKNRQASRRNNSTGKQAECNSIWLYFGTSITNKGSSLLLTHANIVLYFSYLVFIFSVIFFKLRNSSYMIPCSGVFYSKWKRHTVAYNIWFLS